uniref:B30.2/SPRY domain-containing protein n=1 Tax=Hippocampus comes TaxID=109280 RepID=A0A3Q2Y5C3_HIPCM
MASFHSDQFQCSICLDIFNNPSSTPCGHSFCVTCIPRATNPLPCTQAWPCVLRRFVNVLCAKGPSRSVQISRSTGPCARSPSSSDPCLGEGQKEEAWPKKRRERKGDSLVVERATMGSVCIFSALTAAIERAQAELMNVMQANRQTAANQADALIRQLEQEVEELRRRESALTQLSTTDDHLHGVKVNCVTEGSSKFTSLSEMYLRPSRPALDVTLDCNTAHPRLLLSDDMKSLLPDNVERFDRVVCVLGREAITSGRHYWEVQVGGKTDWDLGVARQSINRKGKIDVTPNNGYWFLSLRDKNKYAFRTEPSTDVHLNLRPNKIGVFVDFDRGQVSFYNVDAKIHIYTFNDTFTECIFPFFSPCTNRSGKNDGPLVITPVDVHEG